MTPGHVFRPLALMLVLFAATPGFAADAEPTTQELLQRIEELENAVDKLLRKTEHCAEAAAESTSAESESLEAGSKGTARPSPRIVAVPKSDTGEGEAVASAAKPPKFTAGYKKGFVLQSGDGAHKLKIGGLLQADSRWLVDEGSHDTPDRFSLRRARIDIKGTLFEHYKFRITPDFAGSELSLQDAWIEAEFAKWLSVRTGRFKTPFGLERLQSASDLPLIERGLPDNLVPNRDNGVQVYGEVANERLEYALAVTNGVPDGSSGNDDDVNDAVDVTARLFARPFKPAMYSPFRGVGFGIAGMWGRQQGDEDDEDGLSNYRTSARSTFFRWDGDAFADGDRWRLSPQASIYEGPVGLLGEYVVTDQEISNDDEHGRTSNQAWQIRANLMLTGEKAEYDGPVEPARDFDFGRGGWGAWELAVRWASLDVDGDVFERGFADPERSARHADAIEAAVNWYLNRSVGVELGFSHTRFGGGEENGGDRQAENAFLTRVQLEF